MTDPGTPARAEAVAAAFLRWERESHLGPAQHEHLKVCVECAALAKSFIQPAVFDQPTPEVAPLTAAIRRHFFRGLVVPPLPPEDPSPHQKSEEP